MDCTNVRSQTLIELMHKVLSLNAQDVKGTRSQYCWNEIFVKYEAVEALDDPNLSDDVRQCICFMLNDTLSRAIFQQYAPLLERVTVPVYERSYRGEIANLMEMNLVAAIPKQAGWWWTITGEFTYDGVDYTVDNEIYWTGSRFKLFGYSVEQGDTTVVAIEIETGALYENTEKRIANPLGKSHYLLEVTDSENNTMVDKLCPDPEDPQNYILIQTGIDVPEGLKIKVIGW
jgi:hypothetical protein